MRLEMTLSLIAIALHWLEWHNRFDVKPNTQMKNFIIIFHIFPIKIISIWKYEHDLML